MTRSLFLATLLFALVMTPCVGYAAELRPIVTLSGPHVYLRDLFDDAGPHADRLLGPGPVPGGRIIVAAAQLGAIARQFSVDWRPASAGDRAILEWPGRPLRKEDAAEAVRAALIAAGADPDCVIELTGYIPPLVPRGAEARPMVAQLDYNATSGRFTAVLSIVAEGMEPLSARIGGVADTLVEVPVLAQRLASGTVLRPQHVRVAKVSASLVKADTPPDSAGVLGMMLRRSVAAGQPLRAEDLTRPPVVARDTMVRVVLDMGGLSVSGQGQALDAGAIGERVRLRNPTSRAVLEAEVIGPGIVRVLPGVLPLHATSYTQARVSP